VSDPDDSVESTDAVDPAEADLPDLIAACHDHLRATGERPVETRASQWIGEAEAVIADVDGGAPPRSAVETRARQAADLLSNVEGTGDRRADDHVERARELVAAILDRIDDG